MSTNCDFIVIFPIYDQFGAMKKPDSEWMIPNTYIFINNTLLSYKNWKQNWKISNTALIILLWVKVLFLIKNDDFLKRNAAISKIKEVVVLKGIFS